MKICKKCGIEKDYSDFYKDKKSIDEHENICILCRKYQKVIYWKNNKDKLISCHIATNPKITKILINLFLFPPNGI